MLVFRDITDRKQQEKLVQDARDHAENILATQREPFLVLDADLRVVTGNRSFYKRFQVTPEQTRGCFLYDLGDGQWNIPKLRELLEEVLPEDHAFDDFVVEQDFPSIGRRIMLLNARRVRQPGDHSQLILLREPSSPPAALRRLGIPFAALHWSAAIGCSDRGWYPLRGSLCVGASCRRRAVIRSRRRTSDPGH